MPRASTAATVPVLQQLPGHQDRCVGALLGKLCGDALGAPVEGFDWQRITTEHPGGLRDMVSGTNQFAVQHQPGTYTDDSQMAFALAKSLVQEGRCTAEAASMAYAEEFDATRGYGGSALKILERLQQELRSGQRPISFAQSGRSGRLGPDGSFGNGGAMRIAPVGLAYRNADDVALLTAVKAALLCTHVHPEGIDGAHIQAQAVAMLCKADALHMTPESFLRQLASKAKTPAMQQRLNVLLECIPALERTQDAAAQAQLWEGSSKSDIWQTDLKVHKLLQVGDSAFQIHACHAVAAALWTFCRHWHQPEVAVSAAVHLGGDTDTVAAMVGALGGALHGANWISERWWNALENSPGSGRDSFVAIAQRLAKLDVQD